MRRNLKATKESYPIAGAFTISRGTRTQAHVVTCTIEEDGVIGRGECVPYARYGETIEGVIAAIDAMAAPINEGLSRGQLQHAMKAGAARNAVDCALWDLECKQANRPIHDLLEMPAQAALITAYTISLAEPQVMADQAKANAARPLLKVKVGTADDVARMKAVREAAPAARIIIDANEGWTDENITAHLSAARDAGVALIEQPLPAGKDDILRRVERLVPICADESVHSTSDLQGLRDRYDAVNIKLDKTGGLTEALHMKAEAERLGYVIMVGCMVGTSLAMAPAVVLAAGCDYADLDGPLLLAQDRVPALRYDGSLVYPPKPELWG